MYSGIPWFEIYPYRGCDMPKVILAVTSVDRKGGKAMNCKKYEIMVSEDANFCEYCGAKMSKRYFFPATCPYCKKESVWLFSADKVGENFVDCEHCGEKYAVLIDLVPRTVCVYALVPQK